MKEKINEVNKYEINQQSSSGVLKTNEPLSLTLFVFIHSSKTVVLFHICEKSVYQVRYEAGFELQIKFMWDSLHVGFTPLEINSIRLYCETNILWASLTPYRT